MNCAHDPFYSKPVRLQVLAALAHYGQFWILLSNEANEKDDERYFDRLKRTAIERKC